MRTLKIVGTFLMLLLIGTSTPHAVGFKEMRTALEDEFCSHSMNVALLEILEHRMAEHTHDEKYLPLLYS